jgi:uncharacterized membrane protein YgdD (TMEM256/DUF423 family)
MERKMERQTLQMIWDAMHQYGVAHGLLAGLTALIRGAYESEGLAKAILDAALCSLIGVFAFSGSRQFRCIQQQRDIPAHSCNGHWCGRC